MVNVDCRAMTTWPNCIANPIFMNQHCANWCLNAGMTQQNIHNYYDPGVSPPTTPPPAWQPAPQPAWQPAPQPAWQPAPQQMMTNWETRQGDNCFTIAPGGKEVVLSVRDASECQQRCIAHNANTNGHELEKCVSAVFIQNSNNNNNYFNNNNNNNNCYLKGFHVGQNAQQVNLTDAVQKVSYDRYTKR